MLGQRIHQVEVEVIETGSARRLRRAQGFGTTVNTAERFQFFVIEALDADGEPIYAGGAKPLESTKVYRAGIGLKCNFCVRGERHARTDAGQQVRDGFR